MKLSKLLFIPLIGLFMGSCDMIDYHPYDVRISGPTDINNRNIAKIEANCKDKTTIRFVTMGDSHSGMMKPRILSITSINEMTLILSSMAEISVILVSQTSSCGNVIS